ncbi:Pentatricopeptide repeat-containing protein [Forsythia ovata]|uniref:Pentatricopeptide repeat-containing protein n=1 Tax=Forsythia ovata TaxID=205694 RepID=A0ABD1PH39_9LAMI
MSSLKNPFKSTHTSSFIHNFVPTVDPSESLLYFLSLSVETQSLKLTQQCHAQVHRVGLTQHPLIAQKLIFSYSHFKHTDDSQLVFGSILLKSTHLCNNLLNGLAKNQLFSKSFELFRNMFVATSLPLADEFTFSIIFKTVGDFGDFLYGKMVHGRGMKNGFVLDTVVGNSLMTMYSKCGSIYDSLKVFDEMLYRNVSSWNAAILCCANLNLDKENGFSDNNKLWEFVKGMQNEGLKFDAYTVSILLSLCEGDVKNGKWSKDLGYGRELHCYIVKNWLDLCSGSGSDAHLGCCLIDMYSKSGRVDVGRTVFDRLKYRNVFAWTAMINGYVCCGHYDEALCLFREMQWKDQLEPNKVSLVSVLPAFSSFAGLIGGRQIHGFAIRRELNHEVSLCNALIDMYSKCGSLSNASLVFEYECIKKDAISWSSMICGYGLHGKGQDAMVLFDKMLQSGIKPDTVTVVGFLSACCRSGLMNEGIKIYDYVVNNYDIEPTLEMCACMVDMLGRSGQLDRALDFIKRMPVEPGPSIWGALVSASALHENSEMRDLAYKFLIQIEPENSSNYISLSNLYAASKRWDVVAEVRKTMKERGLRKLPGCSWITINSVTHSFIVADKSHPCSGIIYRVLDELGLAMKLYGHNTGSAYMMEVLE